MRIGNIPMRSLWSSDDGLSIEIIDQTFLPYELYTAKIEFSEQAVIAIRDKLVKGTSICALMTAFGIAFAMRENPSDANLENIYHLFLASTPNNHSVFIILDEMLELLKPLTPTERPLAARKHALEIYNDELKACHNIGNFGFQIIKDIWEEKNRPDSLNILVNSSGNWLSCADFGTAFAPIYKSFECQIPLHIWIEEGRPSNHGANIISWELQKHGIPFHLTVDNAAGYLMAKGMVDLCLVGSEFITTKGDLCATIGTYLKALAAYDNQIPFYACATRRNIDWSIDSALDELELKENPVKEIQEIKGISKNTQQITTSNIIHGLCPLKNYGLDITPARLISGLITEKGICSAEKKGLLEVFSY